MADFITADFIGTLDDKSLENLIVLVKAEQARRWHKESKCPQCGSPLKYCVAGEYCSSDTCRYAY
jgi:hypothetical protein